MLRESRNVEQPLTARKDRRTGRFQVLKLEERIAPKTGTNPQGKPVGHEDSGGGNDPSK